jgi:type IV secretion system protein VirB10
MKDIMSPAHSPDGIFVDQSKLGITRINRRVVGIAIVIFGGAGIILLAAVSGHGKKAAGSTTAEKSSMESGKVATATPPAIKESAKANAALPNATNPASTGATGYAVNPDDPQGAKDEIEFRREIRRYQHQQYMASLQRRDASYLAPMEIKGSVPGDQTQQALQQEPSMQGGVSPQGYPVSPIQAANDQLLASAIGDKDPNLQGRKESFFNQQIASNYLPNKKVAPLSPYEVKQGTVIPGIMISGINSDLPGQIIGQVSQTVYDTTTGKIPLIPQGARLVGSYDAFVAVGQDAAMIAWRRIIFPDGTSIDLLNMPGSDQGGYAGFRDQVNNHYFKIFGSALMLSLVGAGYQISQPQQDARQFPSNQDILAAEVGRQFAQVSNEIIRRNMQVQPTIEIRPGYRFNIMVNKDMVLEPYEEKE